MSRNAKIGLAAIATWGFTFAQGLVSNRVSEQISADLRNNTYSHLMRLSLEFFSDKRTGDLMARIVHGSRYSLFIGFSVVVVSLATGICLGLASAFMGERAKVLASSTGDGGYNKTTYVFVVKGVEKRVTLVGYEDISNFDLTIKSEGEKAVTCSFQE